MAFPDSRTITLVVALATLTSNILSSVLFHQLPDDPFHLARNFSWYLHFANVLSVFGFIGALREHAHSIAIFSNFLIIDTILCSIPRFLVLSFLRSFSSDLCETSSFQSNAASRPQIRAGISFTPDMPYPTGQWDSFSSNWTHEGCMRIVTLAQWTLVAGVVTGTLLQFVGAIYVREYAKRLWTREIMEEESFRSVLVAEERGMPTIDEEDGIFIREKL